MSHFRDRYPVRIYWGCTTLCGCEHGFGGAETDFPRHVTVCPCCGGELAEITATALTVPS